MKSTQKKEINIVMAIKDKNPLIEASLSLKSKWDLIVVYQLLDRPLSFSDLKNEISKNLKKELTASTLTRILKNLNDVNIIKRVKESSIGRSKYQLTNKGYGLAPTIIAMEKWGKIYLI